jgi:glucosamine 6-phosphate synthetase-like amidotransferase/phosphosugar isomerase protein
LVPTRHPVVDIVPFQRLTVEIAEARGREPDRIRRHDPRWIAAASVAKADNAA